MWEAIVAVIGLVGSAAGAIWAAYVGTRRRVLAELEGRYDAELRDSRLRVYPQLWAALEPLAKYAREPPGRPRRSEIENLARSLRRWYFEEGGLYLSAEAREAYFQLQDALTAVIESKKWKAGKSKRWKAGSDASEEIDEQTFEALRQIGSWLRTTLTYDVGTRRRFSLAPDWQEEDAEANQRAVEADKEAKGNTTRVKDELVAHWGGASARVGPD
jgi:hypothetical protein